ncbi:MAG: glycosyl hydrolase, partial [Candidatus Rokuibacteriota bacterium]
MVAVAGNPVEPAVFYFGACAGGVWKTTDGGTYWECVSDGYFKTAAVGAVAVAESDPNVVYAGMGESTIRGDVSHGDGVYRSTDAGKTWSHLGLADTRHIGRVRVHPSDPDLVYVAALGHAFGPNNERGVYRSRDGGRTWERILFVSDRAGAVDLSMARGNPRVLYAAFWETLRTPWSLTSGGEGSSLWRSTDGGDSWQDVGKHPGFPAGLKGKIGVAVSPALTERVWAIVEAEDGGLFRSDDGGAHWQRINEDRNLRLRPWYYCHVVADTQDPDTVYVLNLKMWKSVDGGRAFTQITTPHGDNHDLWIDPRDPRRMIEGNDGGACVSQNGGASWSTIYNQPTAQFYHVVVDTGFPYRVYGTQQDNSAMSVPSRSYKGAILGSDTYPVGSSESGHIAVRPDNPDIVYSGAVGSAPGGGGVLLRYDHATGHCRMITVWPEVYYGWPPQDLKYRFQWTFPILISPHDPNVLYTAGNVVFRSTNEGASWEPISPDLTRADPATLQVSGGPITKDTTGAEHYATVFALAESPVEPGVLWAGSDDGLLHLSRDGGRTWKRITPPDLPEWATICTIELSGHDPAKAYLAATRYKLDDPRPYLYRTTDAGATWRLITDGIPADDFTRVIREAPGRPGLLYAGTETGAYVSFDDGGSWHSLQLNLPAAPIYDLAVKDHDLVAATHGRSFWILDDLTPLHQMTDHIAQSAAHVFAPRLTYRLVAPINSGTPTGPGKNYMLALGYPATFTEANPSPGETVRRFLDAGTNPPSGVIVTYYLKAEPQGPVTLSFTDRGGRLIRSFSSEPRADASRERRVEKTPGMNRFVWNMRHADARAVPGDVFTERSLTGPVVPPGRYRVELTADGQTHVAEFDIRTDPHVLASQDDLEAQCAFLLRVRDKVSETHDAINQMREVRRQVEEWQRRVAGQAVEAEVTEAGRRVTSALSAIEQELIEPRAQAEGDRLHFPTRLNVKLTSVTSVASTADAAPTRQALEVLDELSARVDRELERWRALRGGD